MKKSWGKKLIYMALVLVALTAVLSTATFAWYSAINRAGIYDVTFTASSNSLASLLKIGPTITSDESSITLSPSESALKPMIPKSRATIGETKYADFIFFTETYENKDENGDMLIVKDGVDCTPAYLAAGTQNGFYVINTASAKIEVKVNYSITSDYTLGAKLRIALFMGEEESEATLQGIFHLAGQAVHYGQLVAGNKSDEQTAMTDVYKRSGEIKIEFNSGEAKYFRLVVWYDGCDMKYTDGEEVYDEENDRYAGKTSKFSVTFEDAGLADGE
ncbi:MAG: hypothetical protein ACI4SK_06260 [Christensenellales bacterium]